MGVKELKTLFATAGKGAECVNKLQVKGIVPSSAEEGWPRHEEKSAKPPYLERTGWCWSRKLN